MSNHLINQKPWIEKLVSSSLKFGTKPSHSKTTSSPSSSSTTSNHDKDLVVRIAQLIEEPKEHFITIFASDNTNTSDNSNNRRDKEKINQQQQQQRRRIIKLVISNGFNTIPVLIPIYHNTNHEYDNISTQEAIHCKFVNDVPVRKSLRRGCLIKLRYYSVGLTYFYMNTESSSKSSTTTPTPSPSTAAAAATTTVTTLAASARTSASATTTSLASDRKYSFLTSRNYRHRQNSNNQSKKLCLVIESDIHIIRKWNKKEQMQSMRIPKGG